MQLSRIRPDGRASMATKGSIATLPAHPHQPTTYQYPKKEFGKKIVVKRSFQPSWYNKWPWLHYIEAQDAEFCVIRAKASLKRKIHWSSNADSAFISTGFSNWKDATVKFANHASSKCHKEAVPKTITLPSTCKTNIAEPMSTQAAKDRLDQRQCFLKVLSNIKFLA